MKKILLLIGILLTLNSCEKKDDPTLTPIEQLPKATKTGANTAGCLVNGEAFLPKGFFPSGNLKCFYIDQKTFSLSISQKNDDNNKHIYIYSGNTELKEGETYILEKENGQDSNYAVYYLQDKLPSSCEKYYQTSSNIIGELTITHHNYNNATISGTFWFDAIFDHTIGCNQNENYENTFKIREGRFDMKY